MRNQICNGLYDPDILQDLLSLKDVNLSLQDTISFISSKEAGRRCHSQLSSGIATGKISAYKRNKNEPSHHRKNDEVTANSKSVSPTELCMWCGKAGHGKKANNENSRFACPAYGKKCNSCNKLRRFSNFCRFRNQMRKCIEATEDEANEKCEGSIFLGGFG